MFLCKQHNQQMHLICNSRLCSKQSAICQKIECKQYHCHLGLLSKLQCIQVEPFINNVKEKYNKAIYSLQNMKIKVKQYLERILNKLKKTFCYIENQYQSFINQIHKTYLQDSYMLKSIFNNNFHQIQGHLIHQFMNLDFDKYIEAKENTINLKIQVYKRRFNFIQQQLDNILKRADYEKMQQQNKERKNKKIILSKDELNDAFKITNRILNKKLDMSRQLKRARLRILQFLPLSNLQILDLGQNLLQKINLTFDFPKLKQLSLMKNQLINLEFFKNSNLPNLILLDIKQNLLMNIDDLSLVHSQNLQKLNLSQNHIFNFQVLTRCQFNKLRQLNLDHNYISSLEPFAKLQNLSQASHIYLNHNKIKDVQALTKSPLPKIQILNLSNNIITKCQPFSRCYLKSYSKLNLQHNLIIDNIKKLELYLKHTKFLQVLI